MENWKIWKQMWSNYVVVASLDKQTEPFRIALFLHAVGPKALTIFNAMNFTGDEKKDNLTHIIKKFDDYFIGEINETYERYVFNSRNQEAGEGIESYITVLRTLAQTCKFCDCLKDTLLRDRIVLGVKDGHTRKRLLQERDLTLKRCIDICKSIESSSTQLKTLGSERADVHKVGKFRGSKPKVRTDTMAPSGGKVVDCKFCGRKHERKREKCPAYGKTCNLCSGLNHFAVCCEKSRKPPSGGKTRNYSKRRVHGVNDECSDSETEVIGSVHAVDDSSHKKEIHAEFLIDKKLVKFQVDCGASVNILPQHLIGGRGLNKCSKSLRMWNNSEVKPLGQCRVTIRNLKTRKKYSVEFVVVKEQFVPLLGAQAIQEMGLITVNTDKFKVASVVETDPMLSKYASVFSGEVGKLPGLVHLETLCQV